MHVPHELTPEMIARVAQRLRALADERRIALLLRLRRGEANVGTLSTDCGLNQASCSKHLSVLRQVGLIDVRREGTQAIYRVADVSVFDLCAIVCDGVRRHVLQQQSALGVA